MNELTIGLNDEQRSGGLLCSYCNREHRFTYGPEISTERAESLPVNDWITAHRAGRPPFPRCSAANQWQSNTYRVIDLARNDRVVRRGHIQVTLLIEID